MKRSNDVAELDGSHGGRMKPRSEFKTKASMTRNLGKTGCFDHFAFDACLRRQGSPCD